MIYQYFRNNILHEEVTNGRVIRMVRIGDVLVKMTCNTLGQGIHYATIKGAHNLVDIDDTRWRRIQAEALRVLILAENETAPEPGG